SHPNSMMITKSSHATTMTSSQTPLLFSQSMPHLTPEPFRQAQTSHSKHAQTTLTFITQPMEAIQQNTVNITRDQSKLMRMSLSKLSLRKKDSLKVLRRLFPIPFMMLTKVFEFTTSKVKVKIGRASCR